MLRHPAAQTCPTTGWDLRDQLEKGGRLACRFGEGGLICECDDVACVSLLRHIQNLLESEGDSPLGLLRQRLGSGRGLVSVRLDTPWRPAVLSAANEKPAGWKVMGLKGDRQTAILLFTRHPDKFWFSTAASVWRLKHGDRPFQHRGDAVQAAMDHLRNEFSFSSCCHIYVVSAPGDCDGVVDIQETNRLVGAGSKVKTMSSCGMEYCFEHTSALQILAKLRIVAEARPSPDFMVLDPEDRLMTSPQAFREHARLLPPGNWLSWKHSLQAAVSRKEELRKACRARAKAKSTR